MPSQSMQSPMSVPNPSSYEETVHSADKSPALILFRRVALLALFSFFALCTFAQTVTVTVGSNGVATIIYTPPAGSTTPPVVITTAPTVTVAASATTIAAGASSTISYTISGATSATLTSGATVQTVAASSGSVVVTPTATTTYTITATNSVGSNSQSVTVNVNATPAGKALTSCGDITAAGTYYLANDVSSAGTCFGIDANNITLNLNSHTITYGTGGGNAPTPAIEGHDCWSTSNPVDAGPCGSAHGAFEAYGGKIVQSANAAAFSPVFSFGQGSFSSPPYIHNVTATFQNTGAQFYLSSYIPAGAKIENNTIYDNVKNIQESGQSALSARSAFQGQAIFIGQNNENPGIGDLIENNTIVGSPQGGIRTVNQHSTISGNDISMNATYSNDFCADIPADYTTVSNNNCHPKSGRGFHVNANNVTVSNNKINVIELSQNAEYGGCEAGGAYGVQLEFDNSFLSSPPIGVQVTGNTITSTSVACEAIGLRVTDMTPAGSASFTGNTVTTTSTGTAHDFGISTDGSNNEGVIFSDNTFSDKYAYADGEWDGYSNTLIGHNTWLGTPTYTFDAVDGGCDPTQTDSGAVCPVSVTFTDSLPSKVACGSYSEAAVTINGKVTQCKATQ